MSKTSFAHLTFELKQNDEQLTIKGPYLWLVWIFIIAVALIPRLLDLDVFYVRDELAIWPWTDQFSLAIWQGDLGGTLTDSDYPGIPLFWVHTLFLTVKYNFPTLFQQTMVPLETLFKERSIELLAERRLITGLFVAIQIVAVVWMTRRLFGWLVALLAAIFLSLDPFSLTEARVLRLEMVSDVFVCLSLLSYLLYLPIRQRHWLLVSGVMAGLGVSSKTSAGLLVPYIWLLLLLDLLFGGLSQNERGVGRNWGQRFKQTIINGLIWAAGAIGIFWLVWPALWVKPFAALQFVFLEGLSQASQESVWHGAVFFWGKIVQDDPGPFFYPVVFAFRTTPLTWIGVAAALLSAILSFSQQRHPVQPSNETASSSSLWTWPWPAVSVVLLLGYVIMVTLELTLVISKVDRFLLITFPALNILSALGFAALIQSVAFHLPSHTLQNGLLIGAILLIFGIQLAITRPVHPYYFTYWNSWVGGGRAAVKSLPVGSGEGIDQVVNYLNDLPDAANTTLVCGGSAPWCSHLFTGETVRSAAYTDGSWLEADYVSFYISHLQRQNYPQEVVDFFGRQPPRYEANLQGVTYASVYKTPQIVHFAGAFNDLAGLGRLLGYNLSPSIDHEFKPGQTIEATILWTNWGAGIDNLVVRLVDETGYEWSRARTTPRPGYSSISAEQRAILFSTAHLTIPPGAPPGPYFLRMGIVDSMEEQVLGEFKMPGEADRLVVTPGQIFTDPEQFLISQPVNQALASEIVLLGYDPPEQVLTANQPTWLTLYWQATAAPADYLISLRLLDDDDQEAARWQGRPGHGRYPTRDWQSGEIVRDVWPLQVEPDTPIGAYTLEISLLVPTQLQTQNPNPVLSAAERFKIQNLEVWSQPITYDIPEMQAGLQANFGGRLILLGYDLYLDVDGSGGGKLSPSFYWQSQTDFQDAFDMLLTLRQANTDQVVQEWRLPLGIGSPKTLWRAREIVNTIYELEAGVVGRQPYHLDIALQDLVTGQIEPVTLPDGSETTFARLEDIQDKVVVRVVNQ